MSYRRVLIVYLLIVHGELAGVAQVDLQGVLLLPEGFLVGRLLRLQLLLGRLRPRQPMLTESVLCVSFVNLQ